MRLSAPAHSEAVFVAGAIYTDANFQLDKVCFWEGDDVSFLAHCAPESKQFIPQGLPPPPLVFR